MKDLGPGSANRYRPIGGSGIILLIEIEIDDPEDPGNKIAVRLANAPEQVSWKADSSGPLIWKPLPFSVGVIEEQLGGSLPPVKVVLANSFGAVLPAIRDRGWLDGQLATVYILTPAGLLGTQPAIEISGQVSDISYSKQAISFGLSAQNHRAGLGPQLQVLSNNCGFDYGDDLCQFPVEELDPGKAILGDCRRTKSACRLRGELAALEGYPDLWPDNFGGHPLSGRVPR